MSSSSHKPGRAVHTEEAFVSDLEGIVERDFYPDLPRLRAKQRQLETAGAAAAAGQTPVVESAALEAAPGAPPSTETTAAPQSSAAAESGISLDAYLCRNTSEDNASFRALLEESERRRRAKYAWFYEQRDAALKAVKASAEDQDADAAANSQQQLTAGLDSWPAYRVRNALMYTPEAEADDEGGDKDDASGGESAKQQQQQEKAAAADARAGAIVHENTRFRRAPFPAAAGAAAASVAVTAAASLPGGNDGGGLFRRPDALVRFGPDGLELRRASSSRPAVSAAAAPSPAARGYLATPSPMPGAIGESPLMTWGDIDGTPCRLDATPASAAAAAASAATPTSSSGGGGSSLPYFRIPAMPTVQLADRLGRHRRLARRREAEEQQHRHPVARDAKAPAAAAGGLSPAARRLIRRSAAVLGGGGGVSFDKALRASYHRRSSSSAASPAASSRASSDRRAGGGGSVNSSVRSNASLTDGLMSAGGDA